MKRRFWRAVFRYAAPRTGWERHAKDRDAKMDAAYVEWDRVTWTPTSTSSTATNVNVTWRGVR